MLREWDMTISLLQSWFCTVLQLLWKNILFLSAIVYTSVYHYRDWTWSFCIYLYILVYTSIYTSIWFHKKYIQVYTSICWYILFDPFIYYGTIWNPTHLDRRMENCMYLSEHDTDMYVHVHEIMNVYVHVCKCLWIYINVCNMYIHAHKSLSLYVHGTYTFML